MEVYFLNKASGYYFEIVLTIESRVRKPVKKGHHFRTVLNIYFKVNRHAPLPCDATNMSMISLLPYKIFTAPAFSMF